MRRQTPRFDLRCPAIFRWRVLDVSHEGGGFTRDLGVGGAFIIAPVCPPETAELEVEILLPALDGGAQTLTLRAAALAVRVEDGIGFAVTAVLGWHGSETKSLRYQTA
jgi:hypothetical protein